MDQIQLAIDEYTKNANAVKEAVLARLLKDGKISTEVAEEYTTKWQIIIFKNNWFKSWFMSKFNKNQNGWTYKFVRFED